MGDGGGDCVTHWENCCSKFDDGGIDEETLATARNFSLINAGRWCVVNKGIGLARSDC